jgi:ankyrin repeat protein
MGQSHTKNNAKRNKKLLDASRDGHLNSVKKLLEAGADVNAKDDYGDTALIGASKNGHTQIVKELIKEGADASAKNDNGYTALTLASMWGHIKVVRELLKAGANPNINCYIIKTKIKKIITNYLFVPFFHRQFKKINENIIREALMYYICINQERKSRGFYDSGFGFGYYGNPQITFF